MHPVCSIKRLSALVMAMILAVSMTGCHNSNITGISKGDWIRLIIARAGIEGHTENKPYYMNINEQSEYFNDIQAAVEWQIIDPAYPFEPDEMLNREWTAFTLVNLARDLNEGSQASIKDISKSSFSDSVATAVASGLMKLDSRNMFRPKKMIDRNEAEDCLDLVIEHINNRHFEEDIFEIDWADDAEVFDGSDLYIDEETKSTVVPDDFGAVEGDVIISSKGIDTKAWKVVSQEGNELQLEETDLSKEAESINVQGSISVNFNEAEIYDANGNLLSSPPSGSHQNDYIELMAERTNVQKFELNGFDITIKSKDGSFSVDAEKKLTNGKIYAGIGINGMDADFKMKTNYFIPESVYWHMKFNTSETLGIQSDIKKSFVGDFAKLDSSNFLGSLSNFMQKKEDAVQTELKLATVKVPLFEIPYCDLVIDVILQLKLSGKAEIVLSQNYNFGAEYVNGNFRTIKEHDHTNDFTLKAETTLTAGVRTSIVTIGVNLMDASVNAGVQASFKANVHMFDDDGQMHDYPVDASADLADELAAEADDVVVCVDAAGGWVLNVEFFSSKSEAGKLLGQVKIDILNPKNAPLFKGAGQHFENWQAVDQCTRKSRPKSDEREVMETKGKISLNAYSLAVHPGETKSISVLGLPAGYSLTDLTCTSSDPSVASVSGLSITGISSGSAVITISTSDGTFHAACNVLVPEARAS